MASFAPQLKTLITHHKFKFFTDSRFLARARERICFSVSDDIAMVNSKAKNFVIL